MNKKQPYKNRLISYTVYGTGSSVKVLLHGFLGAKEIWSEYIPYLENDYKIIAIDLPGHGQSDCLENSSSLDDMAEVVYSICKLETGQIFDCVGHSMGGYVALALDKLYPDFLRSIVLLNSTATEDGEQKKKERVLAARVFDLNPNVFITEAIKNLFYLPNLDVFKDEVALMTTIAQQTNSKGAQASLLAMRDRTESISHLRASQKRVLYISGKQDNTVPFDTIVSQIEGMNVELVALDDCGHMAFVEKKEVTLDALKSFWNTL